MKILLWKIQNYIQQEYNVLYNSFDYAAIEENIDDYMEYIPPIDLSFYKIKIYNINNIKYIILDIDKITSDMPNKNIIFQILKNVYSNILLKNTKNIGYLQKHVLKYPDIFQNIKINGLYSHQIVNISWMENVETQQLFEHIPYPYLMIGENIGINMKTYEMKYKKDFVKYISIPGGCLLDDYGLGKSRTIIELCEKRKCNESLNPYHLNSNLIITSHDTCLTWMDEILLVNPKATIKILATKQDYGDFTNYDYVILSYKYFNDFHKKGYEDYYYDNDFFNAVSFMKYDVRNHYKKNYQITNYKWKRVILDDIHEIFRLKQNDYFLNSIHQIEADFKWALSGHEIKNIDTFLNILKFIMSTNNIDEYLFDPNFKDSLSNIFKKTIRKETPKIIKCKLNFNTLEYSKYLQQNTIIEKQLYCLFPKIDTITFEKIRDIYYKQLMDITYQLQLIKENEHDTNNKYLENKNKDLKFILSNINKLKLASNKECQICYNNILDNNLGILKCGHYGCYECLLKNNNINHKCPFCRKEITSDEIYLIQSSSVKKSYGPKIDKLLVELKTPFNIKTVVYIEYCFLNKFEKILTQENLQFKILKGSAKTKYNIIKEFENNKNRDILILTNQHPLVNYGIKNLNRIFILENIYQDINYKLQGIANHIGINHYIPIKHYYMANTYECDEIN